MIDQKKCTTLYAQRPNQEEVLKFRHHLRETGCPETYPNISMDKPLKKSEPIFLTQFEVDRKKRPKRDEAFCTICQANKFLHGGYLVWYPDEKKIRVIGPECGDHIIGGEQYTKAKNAFKLNERQKIAEAFIESNLHKSMNMLTCLNTIWPAVQNLHNEHDRFGRKQPELARTLRNAKRTSGFLSVNEVTRKDQDRSGPSGFGKNSSAFDSVSVNFGPVIGESVFMLTLKTQKELNELLSNLKDLPAIRNEGEGFSWLCDNLDNLKLLEDAATAMRGAFEGYTRIISALDEALEFFSDRSLENLNDWGRHNEAPVKFRISKKLGGFHIETTHPRVRKVLLHPNIELLSLRPQWPRLD